jgi:hypothetical protein
VSRLYPPTLLDYFIERREREDAVVDAKTADTEYWEGLKRDVRRNAEDGRERSD